MKGVALGWTPHLPPVRKGKHICSLLQAEKPKASNNLATAFTTSLAPALMQEIGPISLDRDRTGGTPKKPKVNTNICILALGLQNSEFTKCLSGSLLQGS